MYHEAISHRAQEVKDNIKVWNDEKKDIYYYFIIFYKNVAHFIRYQNVSNLARAASNHQVVQTVNFTVYKIQLSWKINFWDFATLIIEQVNGLAGVFLFFSFFLIKYRKWNYLQYSFVSWISIKLELV